MNAGRFLPLAPLWIACAMVGRGGGLDAPAGKAQPGTPGDPFLDKFLSRKEPPTKTQEVTIQTALGRVRGYLARPDTNEQLPAILLVHDEAGLTRWIKESACELSTVGYVVLAIDLKDRLDRPPGDEKIMAELSAAVRWLRRRSDVFPGRIGVVGWGWGGENAMALAASTPLQACVVCYAPLTASPAILGGLRQTPVLGIFSASEDTKPLGKALAAAAIPHKFIAYKTAKPRFMQPGPAFDEDAADDAWFQIYEFLGKHVEDAEPGQVQGPASVKRFATIADVMRAVNDPRGIRGTLIKALDEKPTDPRQWRQVRASAAVIAEAGNLLEHLVPPRGSRGHWRDQVHAYIRDAEEIVSAADRRDYAAARKGLEAVGSRCAACHEKHR
jgi:carboxymethylenebutenolidase